jgi:hypothetical protein
MAYRQKLTSPSMRAVQTAGNQKQHVVNAIDEIAKSKNKSGMISDETAKVDSLFDLLAGGIEATEYKRNEAEDLEKQEEAAKRLKDLGMDVEKNVVTFKDTLTTDAKFRDRGVTWKVDGEEWSSAKMQAYGGFINTYDNNNNVFNKLGNFYGNLSDRGSGKYDYSQYTDNDIMKKIVSEEHRGMLGGFSGLKDITDKEWEQLFSDGYIERIEKSEGGKEFTKQYKYNKRSLEKNSTKNPRFDGTWDHGLTMINSAWINTESGITLDPSDEDYKNDSNSLELSKDGKTKDVLFIGLAKIGQKHYGKDKWNNASNINKQKWLQDNTKMNIEMGRYLLKEGGTGGISDRGGANQWSTMPAIARRENLPVKRGDFKQTGGAFFGTKEGMDMGDFFGKNSLWRNLMGSWKKGK